MRKVPVYFIFWNGQPPLVGSGWSVKNVLDFNFGFVRKFVSRRDTWRSTCCLSFLDARLPHLFDRPDLLLPCERHERRRPHGSSRPVCLQQPAAYSDEQPIVTRQYDESCGAKAFAVATAAHRCSQRCRPHHHSIAEARDDVNQCARHSSTRDSLAAERPRDALRAAADCGLALPAEGCRVWLGPAAR